VGSLQVRGKYEHDHRKLEVSGSGRFFLNKWLSTCFEAEYEQ
jgi:hypothetical protein